MKKSNLKISTLLKTFALIVICSIALTACSGDDSNPSVVTDDSPGVIDDDNLPIDDDTPPATTNYNKLVRVENFGYTLADGDQFEDKDILYYSLVENKEIISDYRKTTRWDLGFSGLYSSFLSGNNGSDTGNLGAGTSAVGGIYIVEQPFDEVTDIPDDSVFKTNREIYGTDENGAFGNGKGWYLYDFDGDLVRDGSYDNMHIAYALGEPLALNNGTMVPARTLILKTAKGDYAKIKMISVYKDIFNREDFTRTAPKMYFTFEYVVVPKGSTKFEIK